MPTQNFPDYPKNNLRAIPIPPRERTKTNIIILLILGVLILIGFGIGIYFWLKPEVENGTSLTPTPKVTPITKFDLVSKKNIALQNDNIDAQFIAVYSYDIDNDGEEEILTAGWRRETKQGAPEPVTSSEIRIYSSTFKLEDSITWTGSGNFAKIYDITVYDIDRDGELEIITAGRPQDPAYQYGEISIFNTNLDLVKSKTWETKDGVGTFSLHISDIDNDGDNEIITVANVDDIQTPKNYPIWGEDPTNLNHAEVRIHNSNLDLERTDVYLVFPYGITEARELFVKDIDKDNIPEILVGGYAASETGEYGYIRVYNPNLGNKKTITWQGPWNGRTNVDGIYAEDIDNDGDIEIITSGFTTNSTGIKNGEIRIYNSKLEFEKSTTWTAFNDNTRSREIYVSDVDNDGELEIVSAGLAQKGNAYYSEIRVYDSSLNLESSITWQISSTTEIGETIGLYSVHISDIDKSGVKDILTVGAGFLKKFYGEIRVYRAKP